MTSEASLNEGLAFSLGNQIPNFLLGLGQVLQSLTKERELNNLAMF